MSKKRNKVGFIGAHLVFETWLVVCFYVGGI
jgi:hypothetical protein